MNKQKTLKLVQLGILLALVIVLQSIPSTVLPLCLCLIPITLGSMLLGWKYGAGLGAAFGVVAAFWGIVGVDLFTNALFLINPVMTILICLVKGTIAGIVPGLVYKWLSEAFKFKAGGLVAGIISAITTPVVNTGIFTLGCLIIKNDVIQVANQLGIKGDTSNFIVFIFVSVITVNFFIELAINVVFAPSLHKLTDILSKKYVK
ncbi:MAG: ECF transporter S component [Clostridia bacterium]|nr:ECF transporter S component [Clostridia bacterium]